MKILLERGDANLDSADEGGRTPLSYAAGSGHEGIVKILLERGDIKRIRRITVARHHYHMLPDMDMRG